MAVPTWPIWASGDCSENAKALLAAEKHLGKLFKKGLDTLMVKRELKWVEIETFIFKYHFLSPQNRKLRFVTEDDPVLEQMIVLDRNDEEVLNFDHMNHYSNRQQTIDVSTQELHLGKIKKRGLDNSDTEGKIFELYSAHDGRTIGKIHVPHQNSQIFPLFDSRANKVGQIFNCKKQDDDTFLLRFPKDWKNSEKALFLAAALTADMVCFFKE